MKIKIQDKKEKPMTKPIEIIQNIQPKDVIPENEAVLLPYQQRWVADPSQVKIGEKSRRVGLTWTEASDDVLIASRQYGSENVYYVGLKKEMALEYIEACGFFAKVFNILAGEVNEEIYKDIDGGKEILTYVIRFTTGRKIQALSSRPSNLRGMQGTVIIDEAAFHKHLDELLKAAMALTMRGSNVRIISTHNGEVNRFNAYINDSKAGRKSYSVHTITLDDALKDGLFKRICFVKTKQLTQGMTDPEKLKEIEEKWAWSIEKEKEWRQKLIDDSPTKEAADEKYFCIPSHGSGVYMAPSFIEAR